MYFIGSYEAMFFFAGRILFISMILILCFFSLLLGVVLSIVSLQVVAEHHEKGEYLEQIADDVYHYLAIIISN
jgi:hypothetical protein